MKSLVAVLLAAFSLSSFASGYEFTCEQMYVDSNKLTMIIAQVGDTRMREAVAVPFTLKVLTADGVVLIDESAEGSLEDVMLSFRVKGQRLRGMVYLDQLNESYLRVGGKTISFDCGVGLN